MIHSDFMVEDTDLSSPLLIGISGESSSGKSEFIRKVRENLKVASVVIQQDDYYHNFTRLEKIFETTNEITFNHPDAIDFDLLFDNILKLKRSQPIRAPRYDFENLTRKKKKKMIRPEPVIFVEGTLIFLDNRLIQLFDNTIYMDTDYALQLSNKYCRGLYKSKGEFFRDEFFTERFNEESMERAENIIETWDPISEVSATFAHEIYLHCKNNNQCSGFQLFHPIQLHDRNPSA